MPDTKGKKLYAPYGSDQINIDKAGYAIPKPYTITAKKGVDPKTGEKTVSLKNNTTGKPLYSGVDDSKGGGGAKDWKGRPFPIGASISKRNTNDSIAQQNRAKQQAGYYNVGKAASRNEKGGTFKPKVTVKNKAVGHNRVDGVETKAANGAKVSEGCGCGAKMQVGGQFQPSGQYAGSRAGAAAIAGMTKQAIDMQRAAQAEKLAGLRQVADSVGTNRAYPGRFAPVKPTSRISDVDAYRMRAAAADLENSKVGVAGKSGYVSPVTVTPAPPASAKTPVKKVYPGFNAGGNRVEL